MKSTVVKIYSLKASPPTTTEDPFFDFGFDDNGALSDDDVWDWDDEVSLVYISLLDKALKLGILSALSKRDSTVK